MTAVCWVNCRGSYAVSPSGSFCILSTLELNCVCFRACNHCGAKNALPRQGNLPALGTQCPELPQAEALINASVFFPLC